MTDATRIKEFYRLQAGLYDATRWITLRGRRAAVRALDIGAQHDVLEVGCGTGLNFPMLAARVDPRRAIVGIDFSPDMLVVARRRIRAEGWNNVEVIEADACRLALGRRFDRVLFAYSASMMPAWQEALARAGEHLAPGGRITVLDFGDFMGRARSFVSIATRRRLRYWSSSSPGSRRSTTRRSSTSSPREIQRASPPPTQYLRCIGLEPAHVAPFFELASLAEQRDWYVRHIAPRLWGAGCEWLIRNNLLLYLAGLHPRQLDLVAGQSDLLRLARARVEHALLDLPIADNYFWTMLVTGRFRAGHVPPYLRAENFDRLKENLDRVRLVNGWVDPFLEACDAQSINKFNLLDIFDWMPKTEAAETLSRVQRAAAPGARVLFRSGVTAVDLSTMLPKPFRFHADLSRELVLRDRSSTHGTVVVLSS